MHISSPPYRFFRVGGRVQWAGVTETTVIQLFPAGIILIGTTTLDEPNAFAIQVISPTGDVVRTIFGPQNGAIDRGRLSRDRKRLAFLHVAPDGTKKFLIVDSKGNAQKVINGGGTITAWSPTGKQLAFYGDVPRTDSLESFVIEVASGERTKADLPADYVAEDWHPNQDTRILIYMNRRNLLYRKTRGDWYPTRQLDLLTPDGKRTPITKNPCTDNIWARFSPNGDRIAHYGRRLVGEKSLEYVVVCDSDGARPRVIFGFTEFGDAVGLHWFRPNGPPAWAPDGLAPG